MSSELKTAKTEETPVFQVNQKKLKELAESASAIKIGGKGTARRKKKIIHRPANVDDKKLQSTLKKLNANNIPGIEEVNMFKSDGEVIQFSNPKVQAALNSNTFAVSGHADMKTLQDMLPTLMSEMGMTTANLSQAGLHGDQKKEGATNEQGEGEGDDEVPNLVENFDEASNSK